MRYGLRFLIIGLVAFISMPVAAQQAEVKKENADALRAEIKQRCQNSMGDYGDTMVLECMKQDWQAVKQVAEYRESHSSIAQRCLGSMRTYGFVMVLECIRQDVEARQGIDSW